MAEIMATLQFETPSSFSARDEFDQTAGDLNAKTLPVGGIWATSGAALDFTVETTGKTAQRPARNDGDAYTGRYAIAGTTTLTNVVSQVDVRFASFTGPTFQGPLARYTDASNWVRAVVANNLTPPTVRLLSLDKRVAGTVQTLASTATPILSVGQGYTIRLAVDAAGRCFVWFYPKGGRPVLVLSASHSDLATGGALATGKVGFYDADIAVSNTRNYDNFQAFVPTADAACFASQSLEYRHDGAFRENAAGTQWAEKTVHGRNLYIPCSGAEGRTPRIFVKGTRNDPDTMADTGIDDIRATLTITERYLSVPGA